MGSKTISKVKKERNLASVAGPPIRVIHKTQVKRVHFLLNMHPKHARQGNTVLITHMGNQHTETLDSTISQMFNKCLHQPL